MLRCDNGKLPIAVVFHKGIVTPGALLSKLFFPSIGTFQTPHIVCPQAPSTSMLRQSVAR